MNDLDRGSAGPSIGQGRARRRLPARLAAAILAMAAAGCTFSDDITGQVGRLNSSIEQVQNEALLLNIVRELIRPLRHAADAIATYVLAVNPVPMVYSAMEGNNSLERGHSRLVFSLAPNRDHLNAVEFTLVVLVTTALAALFSVAVLSFARRRFGQRVARIHHGVGQRVPNGSARRPLPEAPARRHPENAPAIHVQRHRRPRERAIRADAFGFGMRAEAIG